MPVTDISIDLETMGNKADAPLLAVGMVAFDRNSGKLSSTPYYAEVEIAEALAYGSMDASTLVWWMKQSEEARTLFTGRRGVKKQPLYDVLRGVCDYVRAAPANVCVWGNGSSFDITILEVQINHAGQGLGVPWQYWAVRDMRTAMDMANIDPRDLTRVGTHHNALDDATFQAHAIIKALGKFPKASAPVKTAPPPAPVATADEDDEL